MKRYVLVSLLILWTVSGINAAFDGKASAQREEPKKWLPAPICDLIENPTRYDGALVSVHAKVLDGMGHGILLTDNRCSKGLRMLASDAVEGRSDYKNFQGVFYSARKIMRAHEITGEFYGRFVYRPAEPRLKWALDVEQISDVEVKFPQQVGDLR